MTKTNRGGKTMLEKLKNVLRKIIPFQSEPEPVRETRKFHELYMADLGIDGNGFHKAGNQLRLPLTLKLKHPVISTEFSPWQCTTCGGYKSVALNGEKFCRCSPRKAWS
jgi:hypothetical protein